MPQGILGTAWFSCRWRRRCEQWRELCGASIGMMREWTRSALPRTLRNTRRAGNFLRSSTWTSDSRHRMESSKPSLLREKRQQRMLTHNRATTVHSNLRIERSLASSVVWSVCWRKQKGRWSWKKDNQSHERVKSTAHGEGYRDMRGSVRDRLCFRCEKGQFLTWFRYVERVTGKEILLNHRLPLSMHQFQFRSSPRASRSGIQHIPAEIRLDRLLTPFRGLEKVH